MELNRYINFLTFEKRFSKHTIKAYKSDIVSFLSFFEDTFGLTSFEEVRPLHLRSFLATLLEKGLSETTINRKKSALHKFFAYLLKEETIKENPVIRLPALKNRRKLPDIIPASDLDKLMENTSQLSDFWDIRNRMICIMLYNTGLRRSELISLLASQIEGDGITILGKGNKERFIPISGRLVKYLAWYQNKRNKELSQAQQTCQFLFFSLSYTELDPKTVYEIVNKELGPITSVRKKSPHMLRHAFATHLLDEGADISSVQKLLGHEGLGATQIYTQVSINRLKSAHSKAHPRNNNHSPKKE